MQKKVIVVGSIDTQFKHDANHNAGKRLFVFRGTDIEVSDGSHTFDELYNHRNLLFIALAKKYFTTDGTAINRPVWRSWVHADGSRYTGYFILGIHKKPGQQITYHLPDTLWDACAFAEELERAPEFDGHSSADVLNRLLNI